MCAYSALIWTFEESWAESYVNKFSVLIQSLVNVHICRAIAVKINEITSNYYLWLY